MPFSDDAEKGVLSCIFQTPAELAPAVMGVKAEMFYHPANRLMFETLQDFCREGEPIDIVTVTQRLMDQGNMEKAGGPAFIAELLGFVPTPTHWDYYLDILKNKLWLRTAITVSDNIRKAAYGVTDDGDPREVVIDAQAMLYDLTMHHKKAKQWEHVSGIVDRVFERTETQIKSKGHIAPGAISSGFTDIDRRTMGWRPGELVIIGARPAMGKSALATNIAENIVMANGHYREFNQGPCAVGLVSLEMSSEDIVDRILVGRSGVDFGKMHTGQFGRTDLRNFMNEGTALQRAPLYFLDTGRLSIQELIAMARHQVEKLNLKVLVVDYLQRLCSDSRKAANNRASEVAEVSTGLKQIAKDYGVVVIALAQVGRGAEERKGCRPSMGDLRESGDIEADADFIYLLFREGYYAKKGKHDGDEDDITDDTAELINAKSRRGSTETIKLNWDGPRTRFSSTNNKLFSNNAGEREH